MQSNEAVPRKLAALFAPQLKVLQADADAHAAALMAREPALSLDDLRDEVQRLRGEARAVRLMCTNAVRTGIYTCAAPAMRVFAHNLAWRC
jgi:hypothetical protein